jgi:hypothetical protein
MRWLLRYDYIYIYIYIYIVYIRVVFPISPQMRPLTQIPPFVKSHESFLQASPYTL